jgi:hypothetical protein
MLIGAAQVIPLAVFQATWRRSIIRVGALLSLRVDDAAQAKIRPQGGWTNGRQMGRQTFSECP